MIKHLIIIAASAEKCCRGGWITLGISITLARVGDVSFYSY
ncbi:hypothetical protein HMPREF0758_3518 [Serratia odorifera DSM 4582]|uniref:Uncharacterized protein n=1 Tax=Serratia odorifera DSM 4582 TaxID=667129 RepID=D4E5R8_SEROD|nr:hypothetical protein HMPREF0758_3518 [Serratia odorifera DSM 4582]